MKKRILCSIVMLSLISSAQASVLKGKAVQEISTASPRDSISVIVSKNISLNDEIILRKGYTLTGKMLNVTEPGEWHHNAYQRRQIPYGRPNS